MQLQRQFAGPLNDTIIQRWRDPVDGMVCYLYLPISVQHTPPAPGNFVQYGANTIGSISCMVPPPAAHAAAAARTAPAAAARPCRASRCRRPCRASRRTTADGIFPTLMASAPPASALLRRDRRCRA
jgi:hypothetical protein